MHSSPEFCTFGGTFLYHFSDIGTQYPIVVLLGVEISDVGGQDFHGLLPELEHGRAVQDRWGSSRRVFLELVVLEAEDHVPVRSENGLADLQQKFSIDPRCLVLITSRVRQGFMMIESPISVALFRLFDSPGLHIDGTTPQSPVQVLVRFWTCCSEASIS